MKKFIDFKIEESFDLNNTSNVKKVIPKQIRELILARYIEANMVNAQDIRNHSDILKNYKFLRGFTFTDKDKFLIIFMIEDNMKEVHLMNLSDGDGAEQTFNLGKSSQTAFATTLKQVVIFLEKYSGPLRIKFESSRLGLYERILKNVLKNHLPKFELKKSYRDGRDHIFIIDKQSKYFMENIFKRS